MHRRQRPHERDQILGLVKYRVAPREACGRAVELGRDHFDTGKSQWIQEGCVGTRRRHEAVIEDEHGTTVGPARGKVPPKHRPGALPRVAGVEQTIRQVTPEDVDTLHELIVELAEYEREPDAVVGTADDLRRALFEGTSTPSGAPALFGHVAEVDGVIVGMALWFLNYSTWRGQHGIYIEDLYVRPAFRGLGLGRALLSALAEICVDRGYPRLDWMVLDWNAPALDFYRGVEAFPMDDWTVYRLTGDPLSALARGEDYEAALPAE